MAEQTKEQTTEQGKQAGTNQCPECGHEIEDLRASCPNCGYEYKEGDYEDTDAGNEFLTGSNVDDEGNEITDKGPGVEEGAE